MGELSIGMVILTGWIEQVFTIDLVKQCVLGALSTGIGAYLGVKLSTKSSIKLEQEKLKINMINNMYNPVRLKMKEATKTIQYVIRNDRFTQSDFIKIVEGADVAIKALIDELNVYAMESRVFCNHVNTIEKMYKKIKAVEEKLVLHQENSTFVNEALTLLKQINTDIINFDQALCEYYLEKTGLNKSKEHRMYNKAARKNIKENRDDALNNSEL